MRALLAFDGVGIEVRGKRNHVRSSWLASRTFRRDLEAFANQLPMVRHGTILDGELVAGSFHRTMALLMGRRPFEGGLRLVVFDVPVSAGVDMRSESWEARRTRL